MKDLGKRIRKRRNSLKMSQGELACRSGLSQQMVSKLERGVSRYTDRFQALADTLEVNQAWLVLGEGPMEPGAQQSLSEFETLAHLLPEEHRAAIEAAMRALIAASSEK